MDWNEISDVFKSIESLITAGAIVVGGWWTYNKFLRNREGKPALVVKHEIIYRPLDGNVSLLTVKAKLKNVSKVLVNVDDYKVEVFQVTPPVGRLLKILSDVPTGPDKKLLLDDQLFLVAERRCPFNPEGPYGSCDGVQIEPAEEHDIFFTFVISASIKLVKIRSFFGDHLQLKKTPNLYASCESLNDLALSS